MAFTGAIFKVVKGVHRTFDLPKLIAELERDLQTSIPNRYRGVQRYEVTQTLAEARLISELSIGRSNPKLVKKHFIKTLRTELSMAEEDLAKIPATIADTAELGIAIRELAISLDEHVDEVYRRADRLNADNQQKSAEYLYLLHNWTNREVSNLIDSGRQSLEEVKSEHEKRIAEFIIQQRESVEHQLHDSEVTLMAATESQKLFEKEIDAMKRSLKLTSLIAAISSFTALCAIVAALYLLLR